MLFFLKTVVLVIFLSACQVNPVKAPSSETFATDTSSATTCCAEVGSEEKKLYHLINEYRSKNGLSRIPLSPSLTHVAQKHVKDLSQSQPKGICNMHSWSHSGQWSACCYTSDHAQAKCMWNKPRELTAYPGNGYENAFGGRDGYKANAVSTLNGWKKSKGHNALILNQGIWKDFHWQAMGVGIYDGYAALWVGEETDPAY